MPNTHTCVLYIGFRLNEQRAGITLCPVCSYGSVPARLPLINEGVLGACMVRLLVQYTFQKIETIELAQADHFIRG